MRQNEERFQRSYMYDKSHTVMGYNEEERVRLILSRARGDEASE